MQRLLLALDGPHWRTVILNRGSDIINEDSWREVGEKFGSLVKWRKSPWRSIDKVRAGAVVCGSFAVPESTYTDDSRRRS